MSKPTHADRIAGGWLGLLVGDALGVPYEFHDPDEIPPLDRIEFEPPKGYDVAHWKVPPGTWSDDGAQALCLLDSLLTRGHLDPADLAARLLDWYESGYMAVDAKVFDVGNQTARAFRRLREGVPPLEAGPSAEHENGNGSLMRVLPLALWHRGTDPELVRDARDQSRVTHGHLRSQLCCALYCLWARRILEESPDPWPSAVATLRNLLAPGTPERTELDDAIRPDDPPDGRGGGYVLDCLRSARRVVEGHGDYESIVKAAVALGNDTDTTACVAGGIAGLMFGVEGIPERWRSGLRGYLLYAPLLKSLLAHHGPG